jgi:ATP-binding cassette subfamily F protein uup
VSILISAHNLKKTFGARPLFEGLTFAIESGERIGLIGPNGAGKSTLLKILASQTEPDEGTLSKARGLRVSCLDQVPTFEPNATVESTILAATSDPHAWESIADASEVMSKLSLDGETPVATLSGGWKKRVALARELVRKPDLLLLDEPTNHLDVESIVWLEEMIANARFAVLTVTHDRLFLQKTANRILELDRRNAGGLLSVQGDYTAYLEVKDQMMAAQERREIILKNTLRRETEWLRRGAKARTTKQQARIQRAGELKDEVGELSYRNQTRTARIDFQSTERSPKRLIDAQGISKSYGDRKIIPPIDVLITPGTRIGLLGVNGCGKSTLLRLLLGLEESDTGTINRSDQLTVAYFEQNRETLDPEMTLSETLCPRGDYVEYRNSRVHIRSYLDRFLFRPEQMDMPVGKLSGGEQSRILIAKLMLQPANVLVLDEPTNDLDMATLAVLEDCLTEFNGAVLLVSHDRYFLDQVSTHILAFHKGEIARFSGLEQWEDWLADHEAREKAAAQKDKAKAAQSAALAAAPKQKRKLSFNEQRELDSMEENIHKAEDELKKWTAESTNPANMTNAKKLSEIAQAMSELETRIQKLYSRWAELE